MEPHPHQPPPPLPPTSQPPPPYGQIVPANSAASTLTRKPVTNTDPPNCCERVAVFLSYFFTILFFPITICCSYKVIQEYQRAVVFRMGRLRHQSFGPGSIFVLCCVDEWKIFDIRTISFDIPPQEVLTRDSVSVQVDAIVYYRVFDPVMAVTNVANCDNATRLLASSMLRNALGTKSLGELLTDRESVAHILQQTLDEATDPWGVKVERVEIKDVRLPQAMHRAMAAEAEAQREAKAKIVAAEGEKVAAEALKDAAEMMAKSGGTIQLRYLQTLAQIGTNQNSTIIFPLPMEFLKR